MKNRVFATSVFLLSVTTLVACSSGNDDRTQSATSQDQVQLLAPTPSLAGTVEVGDSIPLMPLRPAVASISNVSGASGSRHQLATSTSSSDTLEPISTIKPVDILGADRVVANPWQAKDLN
ncbi:MAG: hypothetical protein EOP06_19470, partial [Proteobacteria bacterium]